MTRAMYVILDANGRRMVLPRATPEQAIAPLTRAIAGAKSTADERRAAWQALVARGYRVAIVGQ